MSSMDVNNAPAADWSQGDQDLGPLAWVLDELRKSLDGAVKAMRRFVRDAEVARESDLAALDAGSLRIARQQLHQACGALEMVGMGPPALVLRSMESAVQKFVQRPETCSDEAAAVIERASFALIEYLETVLAGKPASPVALFPQYREAQALAGADRVHPADLWPVERRFREPEGTVSVPPLPYGPEARARLDSAVLRIVKSGDIKAAISLRDTCLGFVAAQPDRQSRAFWKICAGFFEAFGTGLLPPDVYVKRVASRVLMQYATLAKGDTTIADRLVQDLLFFCSQAKPAEGTLDQVPSLRAVRQAFSLDRFKPVDYDTPRFGRFDPAVLAQARKRIAAATETWSGLAGGDRNKLKPAADQFSLVCDSLRKLHPGSENLAQALTRVVESTTRSGEPPSAALAMEVATSVLYLQAAFEELDAGDEQMGVRATRLAERLDAVGAGAQPEPLEQWMEELYRRVSDNQTMGSVVDELRATLGEAEKALDQFFRNPQDTAILAAVPGHLAQMRGVLSVLGLDQASLAVVRMRDMVERLLINEVPEAERQGVFEKLGNSLGALGFLIDMLSYQRTMARKLFVYDEDLGELRILMGKTRPRASDAVEESPAKLEERSAIPVPDVLPRFPVQEPISAPTDFGSLQELPDFPAAAPAEEPALAPEISFDAPDLGAGAAAPAAAPAPTITLREAPAIEDELLEVFLEEAREVVVNGLAAIDLLRDEPGNLSEQTTLRRAFHTLKGSSRMVGLNDFGEAAWSMEQLLNAWLAEQKPMQPELLQLSSDSLQAFSRWADDIAAGRHAGWEPEPFRKSADAMRLDGTLLPLALPSADGSVAPAAAEPELVPAEPELAAPEAQPLVADLPPVLPEPVAEEAALAVEEEFTIPDFEATEIAEHGPEEIAAVPEVAEDIDFSVFSAALNESAPGGEAPAALDTSSVDFVLDLELPDLEPVAAAEPRADDALSLAAEPAAEMPVQEADAPPALPPLESVEEVEFLEAQEFAELEKLLDAGEPEPEALLPAELPEASVEAPVESPVALVADEALDAELQAPAPAAAELDEPLQLDDSANDDAVKVIDTLRIPIPLYNVYLNEADEWSRRLVTGLQEWSLELHEPLPDNAVALSHSLAGSSATVGFTGLSEMARTLEHALQHVQFQSGGTQEQAQAFMAAAEDIRRLLHQFAAGFLKEPSQEVLEQLRQILETEVENTLTPPEEDLVDAFAAESVAPEPAPPAVAQAPAVPEEAEEPQSFAESTLDPAPLIVPQGHVAPALSVVAHDQDQLVDDAIAHAVALSSDVDDDIDAIDVIDPDLFPIFEEEAAELLPQLGGALRQWASRPDNLGARSEVLRALHTLKGSSRLAGAMRLGEMAHRLESAIEHLDAETVTSDQIEPLQGSFDGLQANFEALRAIGQNASDTVVSLPVEPALGPAAAAAPAVSAAGDATAPAATAPAQAGVPAARLPGPSQLAPLRVAANQSVRVRAQLLDRLVNQAGEVMISRSRLDV
ncbi:Hpt domain-containing protein, partial [Acidovorax sp. NPDC077664]